MARSPVTLARLLTASLLMVTLASPALAAEPTAENPDDALATGTPARFVVGFKMGAGGALWDEPDNTTLRRFADGSTFDVPIFDETRGGYTIGSGIFVEGIFFDYLGLEIGAHFVKHTLLENIDWSFVETVDQGGQITTRTFEAKSEHELTWTALHVPILVKAVVPSGNTRISLGVGPEFAFASWSDTEFKITEGGSTSNEFNLADCNDGKLRLPGPTRCQLTSIKSKLEDSVYLSVVFGIEIVAGDFLIPIDIHWSYNFSQERDYQDRVGLDRLPDDASRGVHPTEVVLQTRDTMYGGVRVGIAYQFD